MGYFNDIRMSNFYVVSKSVADLIRACGDKFDINTKMSKWGVINETISIDGCLTFTFNPSALLDMLA